MKRTLRTGKRSMASASINSASLITDKQLTSHGRINGSHLYSNTVSVFNNTSQQGASNRCIPADFAHQDSKNNTEKKGWFNMREKTASLPADLLFFLYLSRICGHVSKSDAPLHPRDIFLLIINMFIRVHYWVHYGCIGCIMGASWRAYLRNAPTRIYNTINNIWQQNILGCIVASHFKPDKLRNRHQHPEPPYFSMGFNVFCDKKNRFYSIIIILYKSGISVYSINQLLNSLKALSLGGLQKALGTSGIFTTHNYKKCGYGVIPLYIINTLRVDDYKKSVVKFGIHHKTHLKTTPPIKDFIRTHQPPHLVLRIKKRFLEKVLSLSQCYKDSCLPGGARGGFYA